MRIIDYCSGEQADTKSSAKANGLLLKGNNTQTRARTHTQTNKQQQQKLIAQTHFG